MKITGAAFLVVLIAVAIVMVLKVKEVEHVSDDVGRMMPYLEEQGVQGRTMRHREALDRISELESLCATPSLIESSLPRLRQLAEEAAGWAAGSPAPSVELTAAVELRAAIITLREYAARPSEQTLARAKAKLMDAQAALEGFEPTTTSTDALRDRIKNIDYSRREQLQEIEEME